VKKSALLRPPAGARWPINAVPRPLEVRRRPPPVASLRRVDPAQNAARFYSMEAERDLFGRGALVRR
jgi:hypothetical protein